MLLIDMTTQLALAYTKPNLKPDGTITPNHLATNSFKCNRTG